MEETVRVCEGEGAMGYGNPPAPSTPPSLNSARAVDLYVQENPQALF